MARTPTSAPLPHSTAPFATVPPPPPPPAPKPLPKPLPKPPALTTANVVSALAAAPFVSASVTAGSLQAALTYAGARSAGHVSIAGRPVDFVVVGSTLYMNASSYDWSTYGGVGFASSQSMGRVWFRTSVASFSSAPYAYLFHRSGLAAALTNAAGSATTVSFASLRGRPVLALHLTNGRVMYVSAAGSPRPVELATAARSFSFSYSDGLVVTVPSFAARVPV